MIFEQEYIVFEILDVLYLEQSSVCTHNANRNFDAISFRFESDAVIETEKSKTALSDGSVCYVPSDIPYVRTARKDRMIVVHFKPFNFHSDSIAGFLPENPEKYRALFEQIWQCWNQKDISYKNESAALLHRIFAACYRENLPAYRNSKIFESVLYIQKNCLKKDFSLTAAAKKSFISEPYFRKLFCKEFGMSPKQYVIHQRIRHATALILTHYYSLQEVSDLCGYHDYKHFSVAFKKITGVSPSDYSYNYAGDRSAIRNQAENASLAQTQSI